VVFLGHVHPVLLCGRLLGWAPFTHRSTTHKIHFLMLALVGFKALATMCEAGMYHMKRTTGSPDGLEHRVLYLPASSAACCCSPSSCSSAPAGPS
jgi:hypothetical protein